MTSLADSPLFLSASLTLRLPPTLPGQLLSLYCNGKDVLPVLRLPDICGVTCSTRRMHSVEYVSLPNMQPMMFTTRSSDTGSVGTCYEAHTIQTITVCHEQHDYEVACSGSDMVNRAHFADGTYVSTRTSRLQHQEHVGAIAVLARSGNGGGKRMVRQRWEGKGRGRPESPTNAS